MGKYTSPAVKLRDVVVCLRPLPASLSWVLGFKPEGGNALKVKAVVELVWTGRGGETRVWRRWGREASATSDNGPLAALLVAAQECSWYLGEVDDVTLLKRVTWELGVKDWTGGAR